MIVIGVTGGIGTGKSTVAGMFRQLGAVVLDADVIAHQVMEPKRLAWRRIVQAFGEEVVNDDETIDRRKLSEVVFQSTEARRRLERIVHPPVLREIRRRLHELRRSRRTWAVVLDVPLLIEAGAQALVDALVVVTAPPEIQRERLRVKHGWSDEELEARRTAQMELSAKVALADYVVDNADGVEATRTQVKRLWEQLGPQDRRGRRAHRARASRPSSTSRRSRR
jgi:dephospho-CoA kinase